MMDPRIYDAAESRGYSRYLMAMGGAQGMTMQDLLAKMNEDVAHLYAAAIQYNQHAALLDGRDWVELAEDLLEHAKDDFEQAQELSGHVAFLGGVPTTQVAEIKVSEDSLSMALIDWDTQKESVARYKERLPQLLVLQQYAMAQYYQNLLLHEEEHLNTLEMIIGKDNLPGGKSHQPVEGPVGDPLDGQMVLIKRAWDERKQLYGSL